LARFGPIFAALDDDAPFNAPPDPPRESRDTFVVVEEAERRIRLLIEERPLKLVGYLDREWLHPVVRRRTRLSHGLRRAPVDHGPDGIWARAGVLAKGDLHRALVAVPIDHGRFAPLRGWVRARDIDHVFELEDEPPSDGQKVVVESGTAITSSDGRPIIEVPAHRSLWARELTRTSRRVRIRYVDRSLWVEGWVPADRVTYPHGGRLGRSHRARPPRLRMGGEKIYLHAGDGIRVDEATIGRVTVERLRVTPKEKTDEGRRVALHTWSWGRLDFWVSEQDLAYGRAWERVFLERAQLEPRPGEPKLPSFLDVQRDDAEECWGQALGRDDGLPTTQLEMTWDSNRATLSRLVSGRVNDQLRGCLEKAFSDLYLFSAAPRAPLRFVVRLEPMPYPDRGTGSGPP
jgi:hypothetical protein